jgi:hypothetical protein
MTCQPCVQVFLTEEDIKLGIRSRASLIMIVINRFPNIATEREECGGEVLREMSRRQETPQDRQETLRFCLTCNNKGHCRGRPTRS